MLISSFTDKYTYPWLCKTLQMFCIYNGLHSLLHEFVTWVCDLKCKLPHFTQKKGIYWVWVPGVIPNQKPKSNQQRNFSKYFLTFFRPKNLWASKILKDFGFYTRMHRIKFWIDWFGYAPGTQTQYIPFFWGKVFYQVTDAQMTHKNANRHHS